VDEDAHRNRKRSETKPGRPFANSRGRACIDPARRRDVAVIVPATQYERLRAFDLAQFERFCDRVGEEAAASGLTGRTFTEILVGERSARADLNTFDRIMSRDGGEEPQPGDELPPE
jgi:hypothetical protein